MPSDTQREPTREETEAVGQEIQDLIKVHRHAAALGDPRPLESMLIIAIAKRVTEAEEEANGALEAFWKYARHGDYCAGRKGHRCDCGLAEVQRSIADSAARAAGGEHV